MSGQIRAARLSRRGALRAPVYPSGCTVKCDSRSADDEVNLELHQEDVRAPCRALLVSVPTLHGRTAAPGSRAGVIESRLTDRASWFSLV